MAERKSSVSLYRLCVVYVSDNIHTLCPAHEDIFASAFPLNVSKDLVVQSLKQQNFTSLYHLLKHRLSPDGLRYIEYRLPTAILSRLPKPVRESPGYLRQLVELTLVGVVNEDDRRMVKVFGQQAHLRWVTQRPLKATDQAQVRVAEDCMELCKPIFPFPPLTDGGLYQLMTQQQLLESEMSFDQCITEWSQFDLLHGLLWEQMVKIPFLTEVLLPFLKGFKLNFFDYTACSLGRLLQSTTALPHKANNFPLLSGVSLVLTGQEDILPLGLHRVSNDRTLGVSSAAVNVFFLEQAELGLELGGTGLKTLTSCVFQLYAAAVSEECPVLRNLEVKDLLTLIPPHQLSFLQDTPFKWVLRLKFSLNKPKGTKAEQLPWLLRSGCKLTELLLQVCQLSDTFRGDRFWKFPKAP